MAPEQAAADRPVDARADVFSLGCVLFECLTGAPAFAAEHPMALLAKVLFAEPQRLRDVLPTAPRALDALIWRMLAKDPAERPPHGGAVAAALARAGHGTCRAPAPRRGPRSPDPATSSGCSRSSWSAAKTVCSTATDDDTVAAIRRSGDAAGGRAGGQRCGTGRRSGAGGSRGSRGGSVAVALGGGGLVTDQATQAARCALWLRALVAGRRWRWRPGAAIARGGCRPRISSIAPPRWCRRRRGVGAPGAPGAPDASGAGAAARVGIAIDEVTARLLDARFDVRERGAGSTSCTASASSPRRRACCSAGRRRAWAEIWSCRALEQLFEECTEEPAARVALVTAPPGTGKSRLAQELLRAVMARGAAGRCGAAAASRTARAPRSACCRSWSAARAGSRAASRSTSSGTSSWSHVAVTARTAERAPAARASSSASSPGRRSPTTACRSGRRARTAQLMNERMRAAFLGFLAAESAAHPVVMVLEDVHWGDSPHRAVPRRWPCATCASAPSSSSRWPAPRSTSCSRSSGPSARSRSSRSSSSARRRASASCATCSATARTRQLVDRLVRLVRGQRVLPRGADPRRGGGAGAATSRDGRGHGASAARRARRRGAPPPAGGGRASARCSGRGPSRGCVGGAGLRAEARAAARGADGARADRQAQDSRLRRRAGVRVPPRPAARGRVRHADRRGSGARPPAGGGVARAARRAGSARARRALRARRRRRARRPPLPARGRAGGPGRRLRRRASPAPSARSTAACRSELRTRCLGMLCELHYSSMELQATRSPTPRRCCGSRRAARALEPRDDGQAGVRCLQARDLEEFEALLELAGDDLAGAGRGLPLGALHRSSGSSLLDLLGRSRAREPAPRSSRASARATGARSRSHGRFLHGMLGVRMAYAEEDPDEGLRARRDVPAGISSEAGLQAVRHRTRSCLKANEPLVPGPLRGHRAHAHRRRPCRTAMLDSSPPSAPSCSPGCSPISGAFGRGAAVGRAAWSAAGRTRAPGAR